MAVLLYEKVSFFQDIKVQVLSPSEQRKIVPMLPFQTFQCLCGGNKFTTARRYQFCTRRTYSVAPLDIRQSTRGNNWRHGDRWLFPKFQHCHPQAKKIPMLSFLQLAVAVACVGIILEAGVIAGVVSQTTKFEDFLSRLGLCCALSLTRSRRLVQWRGCALPI